MSNVRHIFWACVLGLGPGCGEDTPGGDGSGDVGGDTTAPPATSSPETSTTDASATGDSTPSDPPGTTEAAEADTGFIFDVNSGNNDIPVGDCDCGEASEFGFIWIANSPESTVTKIDTETVTETGRYLTRSDADGNPSRTSVSISGRAVAVANRHGGVIKIWANASDCIESNGMPGLQTSDGAGTVLPWDEDECVHWYRDFPEFTVQRPIAWAPGTFNEAQCRWEDEMVWTAGCGGGFQPGFGGETTTHVHLLDGETGDDFMTVDLDDYSCQGFGPYGGAVDADGNFWLLQNNGQLAVVYRDDFSHRVWDKSENTSPYGLTVDSQGRPWVTSYSATVGAARFDPVTETWDEIPDPTLVNNGQSGIAQGGDGRIWMGTVSAGQGVASIDPDTLMVLDHHVVAGVQGKGISVDGAGFVWRAGGSVASRIDPDNGTATQYMGLSSAYTYSDMTGFGVANAAGCNPAG